MQYRQKLDDVERRFAELEAQMADPAVIADSDKYRKVTKAQSELSEIVAKYREWKVANGNLEQARAM
jgi:peptide chain release factor 1